MSPSSKSEQRRGFSWSSKIHSPMNLSCHPPDNHCHQRYRNIPSRGYHEVDDYESDMLTQKRCIFQSIPLPRILARPPRWASASSPAWPSVPSPPRILDMHHLDRDVQTKVTATCYTLLELLTGLPGIMGTSPFRFKGISGFPSISPGTRRGRFWLDHGLWVCMVRDSDSLPPCMSCEVTVSTSLPKPTPPFLPSGDHRSETHEDCRRQCMKHLGECMSPSEHIIHGNQEQQPEWIFQSLFDAQEQA